MKNIWTIVKKELKRVFTDKRMLLGLILPGLIIAVIYSVLGSVLEDAQKPDKDYTYQLKVFQNPNIFELKVAGEQANYQVEIEEFLTLDDLEEKKKELHDQPDDTTLIIVFSEGFHLENSGSQIEIYYNSTSTESTQIYQFYFSYLYAQSSVPLFGVNANPQQSYDVATKEEASKKIISGILPLLLMSLLFSGCLSISTESIAGEKERGTIATLLITPIKRSHLAIGKIIALSITSIASALFSFIGLISSLPKLTGEISLDISIYSLGSYFALFAIILVMVLVFVCLLSIISAFAKSVKEASAYSAPLMIVIMLLGITSMMDIGNMTSSLFVYFIPVLNASQCMSMILSSKFALVPFLITILSNLAFFAIGVYVLVKMFNSERIMYSK